MRRVNAVIYLVFILFLVSCVARKKRDALLTQIRENLLTHKSAMRQIEQIDSVRNLKFSRKELDEKSNDIIQNYTDSVKLLLVRHLTEDSALLLRRIKHKRVDSLTIKVFKIKEEAKNNLGNLSLINDLLATNTFNQFNTASVFGPGEFHIDVSVNPAAADPFKKVVDDMLAFAAKFPNKKLNGTFLVLGYADAQQIAQGTALDSILRVSMGIETATGSQLNKELSRLRSKSVTEVLSGIVNSKTTGVDLYKNLKIDYLPQGRGEEFPNPKIRDYQDDDERRRVVFVYWSILPDFQ